MNLRNLSATAALVILVPVFAACGSSADGEPKTKPSASASATATTSPTADPSKAPEQEDKNAKADHKPAKSETPEGDGELEGVDVTGQKGGGIYGATDPLTGLTDLCVGSQQTPFTGEAADTFGAENVMTAYCQMAGMVHDWTFSDLVAKENPTVADFAFPRPLLTGAGLTWYDQAVREVTSGNFDKLGGLSGLVFWDLKNRGHKGYYSPPNLGRYMTKFIFSGASTWINTRNGKKTLGMRVKFDMETPLKKIGEPHKMYGMKVLRELDFNLVPQQGPGPKWKLVGWTIHSQDISKPKDRGRDLNR